MALRPATLCRSCKTATHNTSGYCDECQERRVWRNEKKGDTFYWSPAWRKVRRLKLKQDPLCEDCKKQGRITPARLVDHIHEIKDGGARLDLKNMRSQCYKCHAIKTAEAKRQRREGPVESPPTPPAQPFGNLYGVRAKLGRGGITSEGNHE